MVVSSHTFHLGGGITGISVPCSQANERVTFQGEPWTSGGANKGGRRCFGVCGHVECDLGECYVVSD